MMAGEALISRPRVLAIGAHPDDIEFMMAGTLLCLRLKGWEVHYLNIADGSCGSVKLDADQTAKLRRKEAQEAAEIMEAHWHPPLTRDLEIFYGDELIRRLGAVIRTVAPDVLLVHHPVDYMEDHMNACRLSVTAAFSRGMPNYRTQPPVDPIEKPIALYHALPHGLMTPFGEEVSGSFYVNVGPVMERKKAALQAHRSQREWLDRSQGMSSYLEGMVETTRQMGRQSQSFEWAEGWVPHAHLGFCSPENRPLQKALTDSVTL